MRSDNSGGGFVYSTNPDFRPEGDNEGKSDGKTLTIQRSSKGRGGKTVTVIWGFVISDAKIEPIAKLLKTKCGTGGSVKDGEIVMQGDVRQKAGAILQAEGYKVKMSGGLGAVSSEILNVEF